jgi:hypothetical protein
MNKNFIITGFVTSIINLMLNAAVYAFFLKTFYQSHPAGTDEFMKQLTKPADDLVVWALVISALTMGFFITFIIKWCGAENFIDGLKYGILIGVLFWSSVNFGLYSSSNHFSQASTLVDLVFSALAMAISSAFAAWMLHRENKSNVKKEENSISHH